jgi:hypothetical protein
MLEISQHFACTLGKATISLDSYWLEGCHGDKLDGILHHGKMLSPNVNINLNSGIIGKQEAHKLPQY